MNRYELINPSDSYTLDAPDDALAAAVCCLLGWGQYALQDISTPERVAFPITCNHSAETFQDKFGGNFEAYAISHRAEIAEVLDTVLVGSPRARAEAEQVAELIPEDKRETFWEIYTNGRRTSTNNIGARAKELAQHIRARIADEPGKPRT